MTSFSTSAPTVGGMSRSDQIHAANMATYATELAQFEASPTRRAAAAVGYATGCAGTAGVVVVSPVVACTVSTTLSTWLSIIATTVCCVACCTSFSIAKEPQKPKHPDTPVDKTNYGG